MFILNDIFSGSIVAKVVFFISLPASCGEVVGAAYVVFLLSETLSQIAKLKLLFLHCSRLAYRAGQLSYIIYEVELQTSHL